MNKPTMSDVRAAFPQGAMVGGDWLTHCPMPGHKNGDANPSLSIGIKNGDLVVCCRSGNHNQDELFTAIVGKLPGSGGETATEKKPKPSESAEWRGITLAEYCKLKG